MLPASNDCSVLSPGQKLTPKYSSCRYLERAAEREALQARIQQCAGLGTWQALDVRGRELEEERAPKGRLERARVRHRTLQLLADVQRSRASPGRRSEEAWSCPGGRSHKRLDLVDREAERQTEYALGFFDGRVELYQVYNLVGVERRPLGGPI